VVTAKPLGRDEAETCHQLARVTEAREIGNEANGRDERDAAQQPQGRHDRDPAPGRHQRPELVGQPINATLGFVDGVAVFLERDVLRRIREGQTRPPPAVRDRPAAPAGLAPPRSQEKCVEQVLGLGRDNDPIFAGPHEVAQRFIAGSRDVDRAQLAGAMEPRERHAGAPGRLDPVTAPLRNPRRTDHDAVVAAAVRYR
jgi:hypothetical protein